MVSASSIRSGARMTRGRANSRGKERDIWALGIVSAQKKRREMHKSPVSVVEYQSVWRRKWIVGRLIGGWNPMLPGSILRLFAGSFDAGGAVPIMLLELVRVSAQAGCRHLPARSFSSRFPCSSLPEMLGLVGAFFSHSVRGAAELLLPAFKLQGPSGPPGQ